MPIKHVKFAAAQIAQNLDAIERFDFGVQIAAANADFREIFGQVLGHALRQRGDQHALVALGAHANFFEQVVDLALDRTNFDLRIDQARRANDLLDDYAAGFRQFVRAGRGGDIDDLVHAVLEFFKGERAIVERAGHAEAVVDQSLLARAVAVEHAAHLADGLVRFVDEHQKILRDVIEQRWRRFAGQAAAQMTRIIFDAVAIADGAHHFDVEQGALHDALGLDKFALLLQFLFPPIQLGVDALNGALFLVLRHDVVGFGIDRDARQIFLAGADFAGERIDLPQRFDLLAPHFDAIALVLVRRINFDDVAAHAKGAAAQIFGALVLNVDKAVQHSFARSLLALFEHDDLAVVGFGRTDAVDAGDAKRRR